MVVLALGVTGIRLGLPGSEGRGFPLFVRFRCCVCRGNGIKRWEDRHRLCGCGARMIQWEAGAPTPVCEAHA